MKKIVSGLFALLLYVAANAQAPQLMSYQAVIRNGNNQLVANAPAGMRVSILQGSASGIAVYTETHNANTNAQGLATLAIGGGTAQSGTFAGINWANGPYFLKVETDPSGGNNYSITATSQLLSVPYAQHAATAAMAAVAANGVPAGAAQGQVITFCDGVPVWTNGGLCPGKITALGCGAATNTGTLTASLAASGVSSTVPYTGGNGGVYSAQSVPSTGVTGLTASLAAGSFAGGAGTLVYNISGTPAGSGTASFALSVGGQTCTLSRTVEPLPGVISVLDCAAATNNGTLKQGSAASGVSSSVPYTGGNGGVYSAQSITSTGVTGLTATLSAGTLANGSGSLNYTISGTPVGAGTASFALSLGGQSCTLIRDVDPIGGLISSLSCGAATHTGTLNAGSAASGVSSSVPYTGGNGGVYSMQSVNSTGVTGLTATLAAGTLANGSGSLIYTITGTPSGTGTASFLLSIGGQACSLARSVTASTYPAGTVHCGGSPTAIVNVTNPATGKIWMDRNLGASQTATSSTDAAAYGDLYQWGRRADGHQCRNSATTATLSSTDQPAHGNFITVNGGNYDWRSPQNNNLWQGVSGVNNPCPTTYRIPTSAELDAERATWSSNSSAGAFASPLKVPLAGYRNIDGSLYHVGSFGYYWSSTVDGTSAYRLYFYSGNASIDYYGRANGYSVRCLKD